ncbi:MAG: class I SAM-dependent rRNA methyltransferase, partial [Bacteroidota bacterium]
HDGRYLATGHYQDGSICVRIFSFEETEAGADFWLEKLRTAYDYRVALGLADSASTTCYRLVHAEGDGLPGLIIDVYGAVAVVQCHSIGMHLEREKLVAALQAIYGERLQAIYDKSKETLPAKYAANITNDYLWGDAAVPMQVMENGHPFEVNWETGQKTGFFLDQRDNRQLLAQYSEGKEVLNTFCYTGGFSIYGLQAGAKKVVSVDVSKTAIALTEQNAQLNGFGASQHLAKAEDVMQHLKANADTYDLIVVDPPAFAKSIKKRHNAVQGYKRLNALALQKVRAGGLIFTFSCSQVIDMPLFYNTIVAAALEAKRQVRVMHRLSQPADHPVSLFHPEGSYLKGLVLQVS